MAQIKHLGITGDEVNISNEQFKLYTLFKNMINQLKSVANGIVSGLKTATTLSIGSTPANVASTAFGFKVNGVSYYKAAVAAGTAPAAEAIPQAKYGLWRFEIGADGTIDVAGAAANTTGYATEALAIAALPATSADHVSMGYVTVTKSDGIFTGGTTAFNAANVTATYYSTAVTSNAAVILDDIDLDDLGV